MKKLIIITNFFLLFFCCVQFLYAQESTTPNVIHTSPSYLPNPGERLTIYSAVQGIMDFEGSMKMLVVEDGIARLISSEKSSIDEYNNTVFSFELQSPLASLEYSFFYYGSEGQLSSSKRYQIVRNCLPKVNFKMDEVALDNKQLSTLKKAQKLEKEIILIDEAIKIAEEIKAELEK